MTIILFIGAGLLATLAAIALWLSFAFGFREQWLPWALAILTICAAGFWARAIIVFKHLASM